MTPSWVSVLLDFAPDGFDDGIRFWSDLTGYAVSPRRGDAGEFATLQPPDGDDHLRVQRLATGEDRIHLDLHVPDPRAAADAAVARGATEIAAVLGYVVLRSPGGLTFCYVGHPAAIRPRPTRWPAGHRSLLDQVCIDVPAASHARECAFWSGVTGWPLRTGSLPDYSSLARPADQPMRILFQRLGEPTGDARAHVDWSTTDRAAETARHEALGARVVAGHDWWTVLTDPRGRPYCITDRDPTTGTLTLP